MPSTLPPPSLFVRYRAVWLSVYLGAWTACDLASLYYSSRETEWPLLSWLGMFIVPLTLGLWATLEPGNRLVRALQFSGALAVIGVLKVGRLDDSELSAGLGFSAIAMLTSTLLGLGAVGLSAKLRFGWSRLKEQNSATPRRLALRDLLLFTACIGAALAVGRWLSPWRRFTWAACQAFLSKQFDSDHLWMYAVLVVIEIASLPAIYVILFADRSGEVSTGWYIRSVILAVIFGVGAGVLIDDPMSELLGLVLIFGLMIKDAILMLLLLPLRLCGLGLTKSTRAEPNAER